MPMRSSECHGVLEHHNCKAKRHERLIGAVVKCMDILVYCLCLLSSGGESQFTFLGDLE